MTRLTNVAHYADELVDLLVDSGPLTSRDICQKLGWPPGRFVSALKYARANLCPSLEMTIPAPTPDTGWLYQVTMDWVPVEEGASWTLGLVENRLHSIYRDVQIVLPHLPRGTKAWRRANFLNKHLSHILGTLSEIDNNG